MKCQFVGNMFAWALGLASISLLVCLASHIRLGDWFPETTDITWTSTITTIITGPAVLLFSRCVQRNAKLQMLTWVPVPIALVTALWIVEGTSEETLQEMLQAAFAATFIGVAFDATLLIGISLRFKKILWLLVCCVTILAIVAAYLAAGDINAAFCLGIIAAAMNILNIPHITNQPAKNNSHNSGKTAWVVIPLVWLLLTTSIILHELGYYRAAGIISNAPCMHFVVAFMLWWTSTHTNTILKKDDLMDTVLFMVDNIGIGSVAVFSSSVFTAIFWQGLTHHSSVWGLFITAISVSLAVSVIMYFYTWVPSAKERIKIREVEKGKVSLAPTGLRM